MNDKKFRQQMNGLPDRVPERFHRAVNDTRAEIEVQEQGEQSSTDFSVRRTTK